MQFHYRSFVLCGAPKQIDKATLSDLPEERASSEDGTAPKLAIYMSGFLAQQPRANPLYGFSNRARDSEEPTYSGWRGCWCGGCRGSRGWCSLSSEEKGR